MAIISDTDRRPRGRLSALVACAGITLIAACRSAPEPIRVERGVVLVVENQTREEWRDVKVTVNAYYRGTSRTLLPGGRLEGPLGSFVTGLGYRFDVNRERVWRVEVRATTAAGKPVAMDWDESNKRR